MKLDHLVHVVGITLLALSAGLAAVGVLSIAMGDSAWWALLIAALVTAAAGGAAVLNSSLRNDLSVREGYAVVGLAWIAVGLFGALPYLISGSITSPVQAAFESISGFTTTGATVFSEIESLPAGILLWRSMTQWLGGMGIVLLGIAILPFLGVGGMQLFRAEVPGPSPERLAPRIRQTASRLWYVYCGLTAAQVGLFVLGGMSWFDAINHAFTTLSTGGFSTKNASMAAFPSPYIQYVTILFMYLAGINFTLHFNAVRGRFLYHRDGEWRFFTVAVVAGTALIALLALLGTTHSNVEQAVRDALFQGVSIATTTGYVSFDYELWNNGVQVMLLTMMFMGGMAGSTAGGMKAMRVYLLLRHGLTELKRSLHPRAVVVAHLGARPIPDRVILRILGFALFFLALFMAGALLLALMGHDIVTAIGASAATIGNIGPGLGEVGATDNFGWMDGPSLILLMFLMLAGRLELFTILLLFHPDLWRRLERG